MKKNLRVVAVALLCVLAIGVAAATLQSPVDPGEGEGSGPGQGGSDTQDGEPPEMDGPEQEELQDGGQGAPESQWEFCYEPLNGQPVYVLVFGIPVAFGLILGMFTDRRRGFIAAVVVFWPALIVTLMLTAGCEPPPSQQTAEEVVNTTQEAVSSSGGGGDGGDSSLTAPTALIAILFLVATVGVLAAVYLRDSGEEPDQPASEPELDEEQRQAVIGSAAGEAADRIQEDAELENEVYTAWAKMAEPLPVDQPETSTPAEFAEAAVAAGIDRADVDELTNLFEEVRYGTAEATAGREQRAVEALRRIEDNYADAVGGEPDA